MLIAAHSIGGSLAGEVIGNPFLAFLLGIVLHYLLDAIPHYDTTDGGKFTKRQLILILVDALFGFILLFIMLDKSCNVYAFWAGALGGIAPDLIDNLPYIKSWTSRNKFFKLFLRFHTSIQKNTVYWLYGLIIQYLIIALFVYIYYRFR